MNVWVEKPFADNKGHFYDQMASAEIDDDLAKDLITSGAVKSEADHILDLLEKYDIEGMICGKDTPREFKNSLKQRKCKIVMSPRLG